MMVGRVGQWDGRPIFTLRLQPLPGVEPIRALRLGLKDLLRRCGLRCVSIEQAQTTTDNDVSRVKNRKCQ
jgi:hypothetical protein